MEDEQRRPSIVEKYVSYLSDNLGMLHFNCRQKNSIAQPRDAFGGFDLADFQQNVVAAFAEATGSLSPNEMAQSEVDNNTLGRISSSFKPSVVSEELPLASKKRPSDKKEPPENTTPNEPSKFLSAGPDVKSQCKYGSPRLDVRATLLTLSQPESKQREQEGDKEFGNESVVADTIKIISTSVQPDSDRTEHSFTATEDCRPNSTLVNLTGFKTKQINVRLEPGSGNDLETSKSLIKVRATAHLVEITPGETLTVNNSESDETLKVNNSESYQTLKVNNRESDETLTVNNRESDDIVIGDDTFQVLVPLSGGRGGNREVRVSFVLQVNPGKNTGPSCIVEDLDELDSCVRADDECRGERVKSVKTEKNIIPRVRHRSNVAVVQDQPPLTVIKKRKTRKISVKTNERMCRRLKFSNLYFVSVIHSTSHHRLLQQDKSSKLSFFTRCITDHASETLKRFIMKNLNCEERTSLNLPTPPQLPVTQFVKQLTRTAWIGPVACCISGITFKPIPLSIYPRLHKLVSRVSSMLARNTSLPWVYNSLVVNMCGNGGDTTHWNRELLDPAVFRDTRPVSILSVGSCRRVVVSDSRGRVRGLVIMTNGSLLHLRRGFVSRYSLSVELDSGVSGSTLFLTFHRCHTR